jgi:hypothetical protein
MRKIKAISLHQPWASMVAQGRKTIETRKWATQYRGDLLIVSTKKPKFHDYPLGQALCIVRVVGCWEMRVQDERAAMCGWKYGLYAWQLENIRKIEPFPVTGRQRFYYVELTDEPTYL